MADSAYLTGPIPLLLEDTLAWAHRATRHPLVEDPITGDVRTGDEFPPVALRELIANALIHRDYGPWALSTPVSVVINSDQLIITNPGGLYGVRVDALGHTASHLRNARLTDILQSVRLPGGGRVVERLGSGIPTAQAALRSAGLPPIRFHDLGVRFVARISSTPMPSRTGTEADVSLHSPSTDPGAGAARSSAFSTSPDRRQFQLQFLRSSSPSPEQKRTIPSDSEHSSTEERVLAALTDQPRSTREIAEAAGLTLRQTTYSLGKLIDEGRAVKQPRDGRSFQYRIAPTATNQFSLEDGDNEPHEP
ncbi:MAG: hypothetical protein LBM23_00750 [Propionibacteriaceae bacterium]|nr:hypothetical protein [Propionibacteriaceae bacterium]